MIDVASLLLPPRRQSPPPPSFCSTVHQYDPQPTLGRNPYGVAPPHGGVDADGERASSGTPSTPVHSSPGHHRGNGFIWAGGTRFGSLLEPLPPVFGFLVQMCSRRWGGGVYLEWGGEGVKSFQWPQLHAGREADVAWRRCERRCKSVAIVSR